MQLRGAVGWSMLLQAFRNGWYQFWYSVDLDQFENIVNANVD